jgi:F0F1-type ATP synthase assembly protein I
MTETPPSRGEQGFYFALAQVGMEMVVPIGIGVALDHYMGWRPWGIIGGALFGFVGGLAHLIALVNQHDTGRDEQTTKRE